ncbi:hypothetical protein BC828DRAFT_161853 [Blastocladiella britannica]|nr:hypothetical protein BC828DRAFT_161853 [Blastocladiella britannica]
MARGPCATRECAAAAATCATILSGRLWRLATIYSRVASGTASTLAFAAATVAVGPSDGIAVIDIKINWTHRQAGRQYGEIPLLDDPELLAGPRALVKAPHQGERVRSPTSRGRAWPKWPEERAGPGSVAVIRWCQYAECQPPIYVRLAAPRAIERPSWCLDLLRLS